MRKPVKELIDSLELKPHPEGGFFHEYFRSEQVVHRPQGAKRSALTVIYYLLEGGQHSRWHQVASDEQWTFLEGDPLELFVLSPEGGDLATNRLGPLSNGCRPTMVVPAGHWQAARATGSHTLVTCSVGPGFDYTDFQFLADNAKALAVLDPSLNQLKALL